MAHMTFVRGALALAVAELPSQATRSILSTYSATPQIPHSPHLRLRDDQPPPRVGRRSEQLVCSFRRYSAFSESQLKLATQ